MTQSTIRIPAVAGSFYPADKVTLQSTVNDYLLQAGTKGSHHIQAVIVPHAGYIFSGAVAGKAFAQIDPYTEYKHIFLLGPSHHAAFDGASVNTAFDYYETPSGRLNVDTETGKTLIKEHPVFSYIPPAHDKEHCLEVQLPFLQMRLKHLPPIVPVIIGTQDLDRIEQIAQALQPYFTPENLFVISSDFSHYPSYEDAKEVDATTGNAILTGSLQKFLDALSRNAGRHTTNLYTSACGQCAIAALLLMMEQRKDLAIEHLAYCNSGDTPQGGKEEVVGYHAFAIKTTSLTNDEKHTLLKIARERIAAELQGKSAPILPKNKITDTLKMVRGAFVTLTIHGKLRGCIGNLKGSEPLYKLIADMARAAAFEDPRFLPLSPEELDDVHIEISVLSPLKRIHSIDEIQLGRDGIYMTKGIYGGTFLPQVAAETGWTKDEFLGHCARDKAGLGWDGWKDADIYTYQAEIFEEEKEDK